MTEPTALSQKEDQGMVLKKLRQLIIFFAAKLKDIFIKGRDYPWPKPDMCPSCKAHKLWGHGFVTALFDGYDQPLFLKRYRCPVCKWEGSVSLCCQFSYVVSFGYTSL